MRISKKELKKKSESLKSLIDDVIDEKIKLPKNALITDADSTLSIITKKRLEIINAINLYQPNSVQELADITNRSKQSVDRDLKILERFEVVKLEKEGRTVFPMVTRDVIVLSFGSSKPEKKEELPAEVYVGNMNINKMMMGMPQ
ncbi:HTH domain-containing protein [Candidatus Woesearchaeota archaeon]|nr:HTH domain-containing protein [Candidatus Woesearchaeota archaeon]